MKQSRIINCYIYQYVILDLSNEIIYIYTFNATIFFVAAIYTYFGRRKILIVDISPVTASPI